jgi:hypothetical protein
MGASEQFGRECTKCSGSWIGGPQVLPLIQHGIWKCATFSSSPNTTDTADDRLLHTSMDSEKTDANVPPLESDIPAGGLKYHRGR